MYCTQCGAKNPEDSNFCRSCGVRLRTIRPHVSVEPDEVPLLVDEEKVTRLLDRAFELYDSGSVEQAFEVCRAALRLNPESVTGRSLLSTIYEKKGDLDAAIRQMERLVELNPESTADINRLAVLRDRLKSQNADETASEADGEVAIFPAMPGAWRAPAIVTGALVVMVLLAVVVVRSRDQAPELVSSVVPADSAPTRSAPRNDSVFPNAPVSSPTVSGSVFDGLDVGRPTSIAEPASRQQPPRESTSPAQPPPPRPTVTRPTPPPTRTVDSSPPAPTEPTPNVTITRAPPQETNTTPPRNGTSSLSGKDYQRLAIDFKRKGDRANAAANFRKALDAFRSEAKHDGGGFQAQQGIRTCQLELKLLGESP